MAPNISASSISTDAGLVSTLSSLIEKHEWPAILTHLKPNAADAAVPRSGSNFLPLHDACMNHAPPGVIKALLAAYPAAAKMKAGEFGFLPIHCIFASGGANPIAVSALIAAHPSGARMRDDRGMLPLHLACKFGATEDALNSILTAHPEGVYIRDYQGKFPIDYAKTSKTKNKTVVLNALDRASVYCTVSKNASMRLTEDFEAKTRQVEEAHAVQIAKIKAGYEDERARARALEGQLRRELKKEKDALSEMTNRVDPLEKLLTEEKGKRTLNEENMQACTEQIQKLKSELAEEKGKAKAEEEKLRSDLATTQLKDMDQVEELESLQSQLEVYQEAEATFKIHVSKLEETLDGTKTELQETKGYHETAKELIETLTEKLSDEERMNAIHIQQIQNLNNSLNSLKAMMETQMAEQDHVKKALEIRGKELQSALEGYNALAESAAKHSEQLMIATSEVIAIGNLAKVKDETKN